MKNERSDQRLLRVIPQLTFSKRIVSLVAEETAHGFRKGDVVKRANVSTLTEMERPLCVRITEGGGCILLKKQGHEK